MSGERRLSLSDNHPKWLVTDASGRKPPVTTIRQDSSIYFICGHAMWHPCELLLGAGVLKKWFVILSYVLLCWRDANPRVLRVLVKYNPLASSKHWCISRPTSRLENCAVENGTKWTTQIRRTKPWPNPRRLYISVTIPRILYVGVWGFDSNAKELHRQQVKSQSATTS